METMATGTPNYAESGGIGYHLAALRYAHRAWAPFREALGTELCRRLAAVPGADARPLVIVGPSGGYCLDSEILHRSGPVLAVEIDRVARPIFLWNHREALRKASFRWLREDFFESAATCDWDPLRWWKDRAAGAAEPPIFLFMNVLGQLEFIYPEARVLDIDRGLALFLDRAKSLEMAWISVHDRISFPVVNLNPTREGKSVRFDQRLSDEELVEIFGNAREIETHHIGSWVGYAGPEHDYLAWRLTGKSVQIAEVASSI